MVHARHPVRFHRGLLLLGVLAAVALDLHDEVEQVVLAVLVLPAAVVHQHDEVRPVLPRLGTVQVRHLEPEAVVLDVRPDLRVFLGHAAKLGLPVAVEDHPVDVAAVRAGLPAVRLRRGEPDVGGGPGRVVRVEQRLDRSLADERPGDAGGDAVARHVGQLLVHEERRVRSPLADQVGVEPLLDDALELAEQVELRLLAGVAELGVEQPLGHVEKQ